jgi:hypothetical protein
MLAAPPDLLAEVTIDKLAREYVRCAECSARTGCSTGFERTQSPTLPQDASVGTQNRSSGKKSGSLG